MEELSKKLASNRAVKSSASRKTVDKQALEEEVATFKVLKPVDFAATLLKSQANFRVWQV